MNGEQDTHAQQEPNDNYAYDPEDPIGNALHDIWVFLRNALRRANTSEQLTFASNCAIIVVGILAAVIYGCQLHQMKRSTDASELAAETAVQTLKIDQRAWVTVSGIKTESENIVVSFENSGKTPAEQFTVHILGEPVPTNQEPVIGSEDLLPGIGVVAPNGFFHVPLNASGTYNHATQKLAIHGRVDYNDIFGHSHWTKFCYYFNSTVKQEGFAPCAIGNETEDKPMN